MRKKQLFFNVFILSATSVILKLAGMFFKVFLTNKIGAKGIGLYHLIFTVFSLMIAISCSGVQVATTRLISEQTGISSKQNVGYIIKLSVKYVLSLSVITYIITVLLSDVICTYFFKDIQLNLSLKVISIAVIPVAVSSCFKGYFTAKGELYKISLSQIVEDSIKIGLVIVLFSLIKGITVESYILIVVTVILLAEIISCLLLWILYYTENRKINTIKDNKIIKDKFFSLISVLSIGTITASFLNSVENLLIPMRLTHFGLSNAESIEKYGLLKGMAIPCLLFPSGLIGSFASYLMPEITREMTLGHKKTVSRIIYKSIKINIIISVYIMGMFLCLSNEISQILYKNSDVASILITLSYFLPFMYIDGLIFSFLTALDMQKITLKIITFDSILRVILTYFLVSKLGYKGIIIVMYVSNIMTPILGFLALSKSVELNFKLCWLLEPFISIFIAKTLYNNYFLTHFKFNNHIFNFLNGLIFIFSIYFLVLFLCKILNWLTVIELRKRNSQ